MKTKDTELISGFQEYAAGLPQGQEHAMLAFKRRIYVDDLNAYLRAKTNQVVDVGVGSLDGQIILVLPKRDPRHLAFYRDWMATKNLCLSDIYVTFLSRGSDEYLAEYQGVLAREVALFSSKGIVLNHTEESFPGNVRKISHPDFEEMLALSESKDRTPEQDERLLTLKRQYWRAVREILNYRTVL